MVKTGIYKTMYQIIKKRNIFLGISITLMIIAIIAIIKFGLNFGIDFTGGSIMELEFSGTRPQISEIRSSLDGLDLGSLTLQSVDENGMILRFKDTTQDKRQEVLNKMDELAKKTGDEANPTKVQELRYDSVGPTIGNELKTKSVNAIVVVVVAIAMYIAWAFRKVSKPVASWKYGVAANIALLHDVLITVGIFAILGKYFNMEINTPFVAAMLTVLGYSVNDTIVVFDRIRENLPKSDEDFETTVNISVNQTITRSINTSMTAMLALLAILLFGGETIKDFVLALILGIFFGTYSSIFIASPLLVISEKMKKN